MLDEIDNKILEIIQKEGRTRRNDLAERVGLSLPAVSERLRKLEEAGIIVGYFAKLNHHLLGRDITAFVLATIDSSKHYSSFVDHISAMEDILECHAITGEGTHLLKIRTANTASLEKLLAKIQSWSGVIKTTTSIVLSSPKETTIIKIHNHK
ncbi:MAG: AsnC family transcriptional regulator [Ignavibacteria bacterium GWA2_54_16]|nr:MAG: AsnC family transcriptional regulator [Ignavibacteria bacterium GWA2_54_16]